ncbi:MAG: hypothetical protein GY832_25105 [Chloroflexi bacterium]|nr:hypothetical protein [Chloroflexota bacterium]
MKRYYEPQMRATDVESELPPQPALPAPPQLPVQGPTPVRVAAEPVPPHRT